MILPALSLQDIEEMSLKEIDQRITYLQKIKQEKQKVDLKNFVSIMYLVISAGSNPTKKNNRIFYQQLDEIFGNNKKIIDDDNLDDIMNIVNKK